MPTLKQEKAFKIMVENGRNKGEALVRAGYSKNTAKAPTKVTESVGWQELLDKYLSEEKLTKIHNEGLKAKDLNTRHKYLDTAYKLRGSYAPERREFKGEFNLKALSQQIEEDE